MRKTILSIALTVLVIGSLVLASESNTPIQNEAAGSGTRPDLKQVLGDGKSQTQRLEKIVKSDKEWRKQLSLRQFEVTRKGGTEQAFTGRYWKHKVKGTYQCVCCQLDLFPSKTKFKSGTGWPSFYAPVKKEYIAAKVDRKFGISRTEVLCSRCDAHLGHVFNDGPRPTGLRFCINSAALTFESDTARNKRLEAEAEKAASEDASPGEEAAAKATDETGTKPASK